MVETRVPERYYTLNGVEAKALPGAVLAVLKEHRGRKQVITAPRIAKQIKALDANGTLVPFRDSDGRKTRLAIRDLRELLYPIGSFGRGFYWIETPEEGLETLQILQGKADSIHFCYKCVRLSLKKHLKMPVEQMRMEI